MDSALVNLLKLDSRLTKSEYLIGPKLNPIEALWKMMKERISQRCNKPSTEEQMQRATREEWVKTTQEDLY